MQEGRRPTDLPSRVERDREPREPREPRDRDYLSPSRSNTASPIPDRSIRDREFRSRERDLSKEGRGMRSRNDDDKAQVDRSSARSRDGSLQVWTPLACFILFVALVFINLLF